MSAPVRLAVPLAEFRARQAKAMSEDELTTAILGVARLLGWTKELSFHPYDSRRSREGYPDWTLIHLGQRRILFAELKKQTGVVSDAQQRWLDGLRLVGLEAYVWRPSDFLDGSIEEILRRRPAPEPSAAGGPRSARPRPQESPRATAPPRTVTARLDQEPGERE